MRKKNFIRGILISILLGVTLPLLFAQDLDTETDSPLEYVADVGDEGTMNWTTKVLRVKGNGFGPENVKELGRRKILAKRAANMDAFRNLLEAVKGVYVTSNTSVQDMMLESDSITAKTRGMLNGMRVIDVTYSNDGGCEVTVEVNIDNNGSFLLGALSDLNVKVKDDYPKFDWAAMRKELEQTKTGLAKAKGQLAISQRNLKENRSELEKTREELGDMKSQYAQLKEDFDKKQEELFAANTKLIRAEEKLNYANLRKSDLKDALDTTKTELVNTKMIIDHLQEKLNDKKFKLAVKENELTTAKVFLVKKQDELETLSTDLDIYRSGFQNASLDLAALKGYIYRLKEVQAQTRDQMGIIQPFLQPAGSSVNVSIQTQYTGLLIDARLLHPKPILAPAILNENKEKLYGIGVTFISVTMGSLVNYVTGDIEKAKTHDRVGNNPLIVKPIQVVNGSDLMISNQDVDKLHGIMPLLKQQKVTVLL
jgi:hypothetical protein